MHRGECNLVSKTRVLKYDQIIALCVFHDMVVSVCCSFLVELKFLYMDYSCNIDLQQIYISVFSVLPHFCIIHYEWPLWI